MIFKRLKNLWNLSGQDNYYPLPEDLTKKNQVFLKLGKQSEFHEMAVVIKRTPKDPVEAIIDEQ